MREYECDRAGFFRDRITAEAAEELFQRASELAESGLNGDLETGFTFCTTTLVDGLKLLRLVPFRVLPVSSL